MEIDEEDTCENCGELLGIEYLAITECGEALCCGCMSFHDCSVCFSAEDSDSSYETETSEEEESEEEEE